jgi:hypothetical protein
MLSQVPEVNGWRDAFTASASLFRRHTGSLTHRPGAAQGGNRDDYWQRCWPWRAVAGAVIAQGTPVYQQLKNGYFQSFIRIVRHKGGYVRLSGPRPGRRSRPTAARSGLNGVTKGRSSRAHETTGESVFDIILCVVSAHGFECASTQSSPTPFTLGSPYFGTPRLHSRGLTTPTNSSVT